MSSAETAHQSQASQMLFQLLSGSWIAHSISVVATLGVADLLAQGPKDAAQLASATSSHPDSLYRVMRALASAGVFAEADDGTFTMTPISQSLRSDAPDSVRNVCRMFGLPIFWRSWGRLLDCVKDGGSGLQHEFGSEANPFGYFSEHPEDGAVFDNAMTEISRNAGAAIAEACDFGRFKKIVDAGGGHGSLLIAILRRYPAPRGVVFDLPHVVAGAQKAIEAAGLADRCKTVAGDLMESVPAGADAYMMKSIVHGFNDERGALLLRNIRRAIVPQGHLLVVDRVIPEGGAPSPNKPADLQMLVMSGGRERTPREFEKLFAAGGFRLDKIHSTTGLYSVVEGVPA
jgi:hypothetical protein